MTTVAAARRQDFHHLKPLIASRPLELPDGLDSRPHINHLCRKAMSSCGRSAIAITTAILSDFIVAAIMVPQLQSTNVPSHSRLKTRLNRMTRIFACDEVITQPAQRRGRDQNNTVLLPQCQPELTLIVKFWQLSRPSLQNII